MKRIQTQHERFALKDTAQLAAECERLNINIPAREDVSILGTPLAFGSWKWPRKSLIPMTKSLR